MKTLANFRVSPPPLETLLPLYTQVAKMVFKDSNPPITNEKIKESFYKLEEKGGLTQGALKSSLGIMMAKNESLYDIPTTLFDSLEQFNNHIIQLQTTQPKPTNIFPLLPLLDNVKATFTHELEQKFSSATNFAVSSSGRSAKDMITSRLNKLGNMSRPDNVAQIKFENRLMLLNHSTILTVGNTEWIRPSNQLETVIKNQLMFGQLCGGVTEETLAEYNRFSHELGQGYVMAQSAAGKPQSSDQWDIRLQAHKNIEGKLTQLLLASESNATYVEPNRGAKDLVKKLKEEMTLKASTAGKSTSA